jgi:hypothetical protein
MPWPPEVQDVKDYLGLSDNRDDVSIEAALSAAITYVEEARAGDFNFLAVAGSPLPAPPPHVEAGTVELAARWHSMRRSPDGLVDMGELGTARIPAVGSDLQMKLGTGRYRAPMVG